MQQFSIVVIVVNYKTSHLLQALINSIQEENLDLQFLVVDNECTEASVAALHQLRAPRITILDAKQNLGFTGGLNFALQYIDSSMENVTHFFLVNPDAVCSKNLIAGLLHILEANKKAASVSPKINYLSGEPWYGGALIHEKSGKVINLPALEYAGAKPYFTVDVFSGCATLFDLEKVHATGAFNEALFMYYDEADYSLRLKAKGFEILYAPGFTVQHDVSYSTKAMSYLKTYYMTRNKFVVFGSRMSFLYKLYFLAYQSALYIKKGRFKNLSYHFKGYMHYKKRQLGKLAV